MMIWTFSPSATPPWAEAGVAEANRVDTQLVGSPRQVGGVGPRGCLHGYPRAGLFSGYQVAGADYQRMRMRPGAQRT